MRLKHQVVAISAVALCAIAACSGSGSTGPPPPPPLTTKTTTTVSSPIIGYPDRQGPAPQIPGAKIGGVLTVLDAGAVDYTNFKFDPTPAYDRNLNSMLSGLLIRSLTQYVYDPESKQMLLVPDLATDLGRPNRDFTVWRFTIRPGVKFENGREVTAADVKYGLERSMDRTTFFPFGANYSNTYFQDGDTYNGPLQSPGPYRGVTVKGNVVTIRMSQPFPDMSYFASFPSMSAIPAGKASDPATYGVHPWATGPYMFKEYHPGHSLVLVKNPEWDPATDPGRHQYVDEIDFRFDADQGEIDRLILADEGAARSTLTDTTILTADYTAFDEQAPDRLVQGAKPCTHMTWPDYRKITDIRVRKALAYAFPYRATWEAAGVIPNVTELPATTIAPPGTPGRVAYNPLPDHPPATTDPAEARRLLAQAGELGYPIKWAYDRTNPDSVAQKNVLVPAFRAAGFDPQPVATKQEQIGPLISDPTADLNLRVSGWCSDWNSGGAIYPPQFATTDLDSKVGFGSNYGAFSEPSVDQELARIPRMLPPEQVTAWSELDNEIQTRYFPVIVTGYGAVALPRGSSVHGDIIDETVGTPTWKDIWLG